LAFKESDSSEAGFDKWLNWAANIADEIDPIDKQAEVLFRYHQIKADES